MDLQLTDRKALATGSSGGIGKAIARVLAREGCDVAICARPPAVLEAAAKEITAESGRQIVPIQADLTKDADAKAFIERAHAASGRIDILVNNAGSAPGGHDD